MMYTHPDLLGHHGGSGFELAGIKYPAAWWRTASAADIAALGFTAEAVQPVDDPIPDRVSRRQFRLQLLSMGLLDQVETWIAAQPQAVQIAYEQRAAFVRDDAMMQSGFGALGFAPEQVDAFFTAAAQL